MEQQQGDEEIQGSDESRTMRNSLRKAKEKIAGRSRFVFVVNFAISIAMLTVGIMKLHKCPVEGNIPLYLIIAGSLGIVCRPINFYRSAIQNYPCVRFLEAILNLAEIVVFILGSYWVFKEFQPNYDPAKSDYCDKTAYMFAFIYLAITYALCLATLCGFFCFLCCICCILAFGAEQSERTDVERQNTIEGTGILNAS